MLPAFAYRRVSTLRQVDEGQSLDAQAERIADYCRARGWQLVESYEEAGKSGRTMNKRPQLERAIGAVCESHGVLVVYSLSRLARSTIDACRILERLQGCGGQLAIVDNQLDTTTANGRMLFNIFAAIAQFESEQIGERVKVANEHTRARVGYRTQGRQPFGWTWDDRARERVPDPLAQSTLAFIHDARKGREPLSYAAIASQLNELMRPAPKGGLWHQRSVQRVHVAAVKLWRRTH